MKTYIKFGLFASIACAIVTFLGYFTGIDRSEYLILYNISSIVTISSVFIFYGIKEKKDQDVNGFISYATCFKLGFRIAFVESFIYSAFIYFYYTYFDEGFMDYQLKKRIAEIQNLPLDQKQIELQLETVKLIMNNTTAIFSSFFMILFFGVFISLIVASILKKENQDEIS